MITFALLCVAALVFAASMTGRGRDLYWNQTHHAYYGWVIALAGLAGGWPVTTWIGIGLAWDDSVQHALQNLVPALRTRRPSLLWWLYARTLARLSWAQRLNTWADRVFR